MAESIGIMEKHFNCDIQLILLWGCSETASQNKTNLRSRLFRNRVIHSVAFVYIQRIDEECCQYLAKLKNLVFVFILQIKLYIQINCRCICFSIFRLREQTI